MQRALQSIFVGVLRPSHSFLRVCFHGAERLLVPLDGRLERPDLPQAEVRHIEPRRVWSTDDADELRAVAPVAHSFGRRGR